MTDGHCFISYSNADGLEFATRLSNELAGRHPFITVWFDKNDLDSGEPWDTQIAEAIQGCKCLVYLMTDDSVTDNSVCKDEWTWALKYKKPIVPIHMHKKAELPFRLNNLQYIDFSSNFDSGIAQLREKISDLDSPKGILIELKHRLADAQRDLRRAKPDDQPRIKAELDELTEQIKRQEEIVRNPKAAEEKTEKNIQSGLERERQPEKPVAGKTSTRFINPPPGIAPNYFQDRLIETEQIRDFLNNDSQRLLTIVGRAGVGKTAMVCRLLKALERGELPDDLGEMKVDGIVYLSETGSHRVNFANVFADLSKLLPKDDTERLEGIYKNPQTSTGDKMRALLDAFPSGRVILLLDNFETLIDPESLSLRDSELSDALNALLGGQHHAVKAVITTRIAPRDLAISEPGRQHHLSLDEGLESPYAENVLREMDADGRVGLKSAPDALLNKAREKTRGYPRALEALYAILSVDRYTTLEELLEISLPDEVVQKLVGEAFNRLDPSAQKVMQALAVYNRPVSPAAIDYLLQPHLPSIDSALVLNRLVNMHFARREAGRYYLHPADKEYAFSIIPEKDLTTKDTKVTKENQEELTAKTAKDAKEELDLLFESSRSLRASRLTNAFTQHDLLNRAADYFAQARKPRAEWKKLDDLAAQLAEFDLRCAAGDYDTAADVLTDFDGDYLLLWGHYRLMIDLHEAVEGRIHETSLQFGNLNGLGIAYALIGQVKKAITYLDKGVTVSQQAKNHSWENTFLGGLGNRYLQLGDARKAVGFYERALVGFRESGDRSSEGKALNNIGKCYSHLGDVRKAIGFYEQALNISREIGDRVNEGNIIGSLGSAYGALGDAHKAIEFNEQCLKIAREIGDRGGEGSALGGLGNAYNVLGNARQAIEYYEQALSIAFEIGDRSDEGDCIGNLAGVYASLGNARQAIELYEQQLAITREIDDLGGEGRALSNIASQYSGIGQYDKSIDYYNQALQNAREIGNRYGESKRLNGLAGVLIEKGDLQNAINHSQESLQIGQEISSPEVCIESSYTLASALLFSKDLEESQQVIQNVEKYNNPNYIFNVSCLHGIIALRQGERETAQEAFTKSIAQADEILAKTPDYYSALDAKGLALCGAAIAADDGRQTVDRGKTVAEAAETFKLARKIAPHAGVVKSVLRLFDELVKCDEDGVLKDVRKVISG